jgi:hypothetical protein
MSSLEAISPELVLVDPELARAERARLLALGEVAPFVVSRQPTFFEAMAEPWTPRNAVAPRDRRAEWLTRDRLRDAVLVLALLANGLLLAIVVSGRHSDTPSGIVAAALPAPVKAGVRTAPATPARARRALSKGDVERQVLALIFQSPSTRLPQQWIDRTTGLAKDNLHVSCRKTAEAPLFRCLVRPASDPRGSALVVHYRKSRRGQEVFTWTRAPRRSAAAARGSPYFR